MNITERNKDLFRRLIVEVINPGRLDLADRFLTADRPDYQQFGMPPDLTKGYEGFRRTVGMFRAGFPDLTFTSEWMIGEGDKVLSYNRIEGTHQNPFMGIPPTNKRFTAYAADICSFDGDGKITAHWGVFDMFSAMIQLGVMPAPGA
jgi:predicted ester cyclase